MKDIIPKLKKITTVSILMFITELLLGYSGKMLIIKGISIRYIFFAIVFLCLYSLFFLIAREKKISFFSFKRKNAITKCFNILDWSVVVLFAVTFISWFITPQIIGNGFSLATKEIIGSILMLSLYFPFRFLIAWNEIDVKFIVKWIYYAVALLSLWNIILFVGMTIKQSFAQDILNAYQTFMGKNAEVPKLVMGHGGYPRVMFTSSVYVLLGICLVLTKTLKLKIVDIAVFLIHVFSLLATMTKSIWFGAIIAFLVYAVIYTVVMIKSKEYRKIGYAWALGVIACVMSIILNATLFQGLIGARLGNSFATTSQDEKQQEVVSEITEDVVNSEKSSVQAQEPKKNISETKTKQHKEQVDIVNLVQLKSNITSVNVKKNSPVSKIDYSKIDQEGAIISNDIKVEQVKRLIEKWKSSPVFGYGYGSYLEDYIRSEEAVFSYEMQFPALLMKTGVLGVGSLIFVVVAAIYTMYKKTKENKVKFCAWIFLLVSFGITIQTNPLLLNAIGSSILLFVLLSCIKKEDKKSTIETLNKKME